MPDWSDKEAARRAGTVPGYIGQNTSLTDAPRPIPGAGLEGTSAQRALIDPSTFTGLYNETDTGQIWRSDGSSWARFGTYAPYAALAGTLASKAQNRSKVARDAQAAWTPANLGGLVGWWNADDLVTAGLVDGSAIAAWADRSPKANNLAQATGSQQPTLKTGANGINGRPVARFASASSQILTITNPTGIPQRAATKGLTVLVVYRPVTDVVGNFVGYTPSTANGWHLGLSSTGGNVQFSLQGAFVGFSLSRTMTAMTAHQVSVVMNTDLSVDMNMDHANRNDGVTYDKHLAASREIAGTCTIFSIGGSAYSSSTSFTNGDIAEVVILDHALTETEKTEWARYCAVRYNILAGSTHNATAALAVPTYDGSGIVTEPSVIDFGPNNSYLGFRWWMACVPFTSQSASNENPQILASNDKLTWVVPPGVTNPIMPKPTLGTNADPCLRFFNNKLYLWWIVQVNGAGAGVWCTSSSDGFKTFAAIQQTSILPVTGDTSSVSILEPKVVYDSIQGVYVCFVSNNFATPMTFDRCYSSSPDGPWGPRASSVLTIPGTALDATGVSTAVARAPFHFDVQFDPLGLYRLICSANDVFRNFWAASSADGAQWTFSPYPVMTPSIAGWDNNSMYRMCWTQPLDGDGLTYDAWYSAVDSVPSHHIGHTTLPASVFP